MNTTTQTVRSEGVLSFGSATTTYYGQTPEGQIHEVNKLQGGFWLAEENLPRLKERTEAEWRTKMSSTRPRERFGMCSWSQICSLLAVRRDRPPELRFAEILNHPDTHSVAYVKHLRIPPPVVPYP
jgi:hypothetical protein